MIVRKVISGGQTGVDEAALRAAQACGLEIGGWCSPGTLNESGPIRAEFRLRETPHERSERAADVPRSLRTEWNVRDSDATLILLPRSAPLDDRGTAWTQQCATELRKPYLIEDPADPKAADRIVRWLTSASAHTLNVAGPSERTCPGIARMAYELLFRVFSATD